jgi:hypothetical protein
MGLLSEKKKFHRVLRQDKRSSANESSSREIVTSHKRKRKSYYIRKFPIPRLLKRDLRRDIPRMVTNVLNSHDPHTISSFFRYTCVPSCFFVNGTLPPSEQKLLTSDASSLSGESSHESDDSATAPPGESLNDLINGWLMNFSVFPDMTVQLLNAQIVQSQEFKGSKIVLSCVLKGTKLYHDRECVTDFKPSHPSPDSSSSTVADTDDDSLSTTSSSTSTSTTLNSINTMSPKEQATYRNAKSTNEIVDHRIPLAQPFELTMYEIITISLNEEYLGTGIECAFAPGTKEIITPIPLSQAFHK